MNSERVRDTKKIQNPDSRGKIIVAGNYAGKVVSVDRYGPMVKVVWDFGRTSEVNSATLIPDIFQPGELLPGDTYNWDSRTWEGETHLTEAQIESIGRRTGNDGVPQSNWATLLGHE